MRSPAYGEDLAAVHAAAFTDLANAAAKVLLRELKDRRLRSGLVVDVGCGDGTLARRVVAKGYDALAVDASPAMLRLARRRVPRARFARARWQEVPLPPCVAIAAVGEILSSVAAPRPPEAALRGFLRRAAGALAPGGALFFDLVEEVREAENREGVRADPHGRWAVLIRVSQRPGGRLVRRRITTFRRVGRVWRRSVEEHLQWRYRRAEVLQALRAAGFHVRTARGYGASRLREGSVAFVAVRRRGKATAASGGR